MSDGEIGDETVSHGGRKRMGFAATCPQHHGKLACPEALSRRPLPPPPAPTQLPGLHALD
eukprot:726123-Prorocentrum_lima.AAC.1